MNADRPAGAWRFGAYVFDANRHTLTRNGRAVELSARAAATLAFFLEHAGAVVTKDGILAAVWPEGCVEPANVPQTIYLLRRTFKLAGDDQEIIATVPGGYRFVAAVAPAGARERVPLRRLPAPALAALVGSALAIGLVLSLASVRQPSPPVPQIAAAARVAYQQGRFYWSRRTPANVRLALNLFQSAIKLSPQYAQAYSGLADTYSVMRQEADTPAEAKRLGELSRQAARRALALDDACGECYASQAFIDAWDVRNSAKAEGEFRRAIQLDPGYATAHEWYAWFLFYKGDQEAEALAEIEKANELDPTSSIIKIAYGWQLFYVRQFERAAGAFTDASTIDPKNDDAYFGIALSREQLGQLDDAVSAIEEARRINTDPMYDAERGRLLAEQHRRRDAEVALQRLLSAHPRPWYSLALMYDALGQHALAQQYLKLAAKNHDAAMMTVFYDPRIDDLRPTVRY